MVWVSGQGHGSMTRMPNVNNGCKQYYIPLTVNFELIPNQYWNLEY